MSDPQDLRDRAAGYRRLAAEARDPDTRDSLLALAADFETEAARLEGPTPQPPAVA
ncbi:MAG: hypothetical protein ACK4K7_13745 [Allosphingosinicella sp.]|uniref:hypothetical protein n=1 Tax=Allosphingosinicella sp. TaxID=2823234 RepID=UPI00396150B1